MSIEPLLSEYADDPEMAELIDEFRMALADLSDQLEEALGAIDFNVIYRIAHQLKGSAGGYGYPQISQVAGLLDAACEATGALDDNIEARTKELVSICRRAQLRSSEK